MLSSEMAGGVQCTYTLSLRGLSHRSPSPTSADKSGNWSSSSSTVSTGSVSRFRGHAMALPAPSPSIVTLDVRHPPLDVILGSDPWSNTTKIKSFDRHSIKSGKSATGHEDYSSLLSDDSDNSEGTGAGTRNIYSVLTRSVASANHGNEHNCNGIIVSGMNVRKNITGTGLPKHLSDSSVSSSPNTYTGGVVPQYPPPVPPRPSNLPPIHSQSQYTPRTSSASPSNPIGSSKYKVTRVGFGNWLHLFGYHISWNMRMWLQIIKST